MHFLGTENHKFSLYSIRCQYEKKYIYSINYKNQLIGLVGRVFTNVPGDLGSVLGRVIPKSLKMVHSAI